MSNYLPENRDSLREAVEALYVSKFEILSAITETASKEGALIIGNPNKRRLDVLEDVAWRKLGTTQFEIEQATLHGLPEKDRAKYLTDLENSSIFSRESMAELKKEFSLAD